MEHVRSIEAIVAKLIVDNLVGWEITDCRTKLTARHKTVDGKEEGGLGELALVIAILGITYGRHRHHHLDTGIAPYKQ